MKTSKVAIILLYDKENVLFQDRKKISKHGEEYGFFGGHMEGEESPEQTLKRELKEELGIDINKLENLEFFKQFDTKISQWNREIKRSVFLAKMPDIKNLKVTEGKAITINIKDTFNLKMIPGDLELLKEIYEHLKCPQN